MTIDWRRMFKKYVGIVGEHEGVDFLHDYEWSRKEWEALCELFPGLPGWRERP